MVETRKDQQFTDFFFHSFSSTVVILVSSHKWLIRYDSVSRSATGCKHLQTCRMPQVPRLHRLQETGWKGQPPIILMGPQGRNVNSPPPACLLRRQLKRWGCVLISESTATFLSLFLRKKRPAQPQAASRKDHGRIMIICCAAQRCTAV